MRLVYLYDLFPTICDFARVPIPESVEGDSLAPIIDGKTADVRPYLFAAYRDWQRMVRDKRWKLIEYVVGGQHHTQLFDLSVDRDELNNLADKESSVDIVARLRQQLVQMAISFGDPDAAVYRDALAAKKSAVTP